MVYLLLKVHANIDMHFKKKVFTWIKMKKLQTAKKKTTQNPDRRE